MTGGASSDDDETAVATVGGWSERGEGWVKGGWVERWWGGKDERVRKRMRKGYKHTQTNYY